MAAQNVIVPFHRFRRQRYRLPLHELKLSLSTQRRKDAKTQREICVWQIEAPNGEWFQEAKFTSFLCASASLQCKWLNLFIFGKVFSLRPPRLCADLVFSAERRNESRRDAEGAERGQRYKDFLPRISRIARMGNPSFLIRAIREIRGLISSVAAGRAGPLR